MTVIVTVLGVPRQPLADGVTVMVATTGLVPVFVGLNMLMTMEPVLSSLRKLCMDVLNLLNYGMTNYPVT